MQVYNDLKDRVLIKTYTSKGPLVFRIDTRHEACRWNSCSWARDPEKPATWDFGMNIPGHEEDNEAVLFASPNFTLAVQSDLSVIITAP